MATSLLILSAVLFICLFLVQLQWGFRFASMFKKFYEQPEVDVQKLPETLIILSLRGADPFLGRALENILQQSHSRFRLKIIIDSETDSAWATVNPFLAKHPDSRVEVETLKVRHLTCGLRSNATLQATSAMPPEIGAVVIVDADAIPYKHWLRDLVAPLLDENIGAVSGLRWYTPARKKISDVARCTWGAGAMLQMFAFNMMWGGSLAIRRSAVDSPEMRDAWRKCIIDDLVVAPCVNKLGLKAIHTPVVMANSEQVSLIGSIRFIQRQVFFSKFSGKSWSCVMGFSLISFVAFNSAVLATLLPPYSSFWFNFAAMIFIIGIYGNLNRALISWADSLCRKRLTHQGDTVPPRIFPSFFNLVVTFLIYTFCTISVVRKKRIQWRGIDYVMTSKNTLLRLNDTPYLEVEAAPGTSVL